MRLFIFLLFSLAAGATSASGLQVSPVSLSISASDTAQIIWLSNTGDAPLNAQVRAFRWRQHGGKDVLEPTRDLVVSPPMLAVPPGKKQLIRVIRPRATEERETAWRLIIDELPAGKPQSGLEFILRYSIPVFVLPANKIPLKPELHTHLQTTPSGLVLHIHNRGNEHAQIADLRLQPSTGKSESILLPGLVGYVLPGSTMAWQLPVTKQALVQGSLKARINGEMEASTLVDNGG